MPVSPEVQSIITKHKDALALLREQEKKLFADSATEVRRLRCVCSACKKEMTVGDLIFIQDTRITSTHGCFGGGDQVDCDPGQCYMACPFCGQQHRLYNHPRCDDIHACIEALKPSGLRSVFGENIKPGRLRR